MTDLTTTERRDRYEAVLAAIDGATSDAHTYPGARLHSILTNCCSTGGDHDPDGIRSALRAACEQGDAIKWRDLDGDVRYSRCTEGDLRDLVEWAAEEREDPELVGRVNRRLAEVTGDD